MKVLIADDDPTIREVVSHLVADAGYEVLSASGGAEALESIVREKPEIVLAAFTGSQAVHHRLHLSVTTACLPRPVLLGRYRVAVPLSLLTGEAPRPAASLLLSLLDSRYNLCFTASKYWSHRICHVNPLRDSRATLN